LLDALRGGTDLTVASQILPRRKGILRLRRDHTTKIIGESGLRETIANAIVLEPDGSVVLGWSGPHSSTASAVTATANPVIAQRKICGGLTILVPGLRGGRCITLGSGTSTMNPTTTVTTTKNLQKRSWSGKKATPSLTLKIVA